MLGAVLTVCPPKNKSKIYENSRQASTSQKQSHQNESTQIIDSPTRGQLANSAAESNVTQTFINRESHHALLSTALVMAKGEFGEPTVLRCLIDSGSQASFITEDACKKLCASRTPTSVEITGLNANPSAAATQQTKLQLTSRGCNRTTIEENFLVLNNITNSLPTKVVSRDDCRHLTGLKLADPTFWKPGRIDALLGARVYAKIVREGIRRGPDTAPVAVNTIFGWIILGSTNKTLDGDVESRTFTTTVDLNEQFKKFWELEELPISPLLNKRERECQETYQASYKRLSNGTYQVKLPFINNEIPMLGHSRSQALKRLQSNDLWWHGPSWLVSHPNDWPKSKIANSHTDLEAKKVVTSSFIINAEDDILLRYSSFTRLVRIVATMKRFIHNCRNPQTKRLGFLNSSEWNQASTIILKMVQRTVFQDDYNHLLHKKPLPNNSRLLKLNPFIDSNGLLRLGGRLDNASIPYTRRHPIILPQQHHVTSIIIDKFHRETLHGGPSLVLSMSRNQYWILNARRCITSRIHKCITCARHRKLASTQLMGNLPSSRVNITKPFTKVGIDYAGPITIKTSTLRNAKRQKAYFCIFICMATRAIHIELVSDLTAEAFIAALRRFVARRGLCRDIFSDCGTNFIGAKAILEKDLRRAIKEAEQEAAQYLASQAITWHFNPPASPHFGGIWEAGVKSIKYHLRRTLGNSICTFEEYATILTQIEACLNSRPLCQVHNDPDELFILTPGHFLIGQPLNAIPEPDYSNHKASLSQRWKYFQQLVKQFWDKWSKDYLNQLQHRPKWSTTQSNIKTGDIVVIKNENMPPTSWPLGIIERVYPGTDGLVRVVQIRTQNSTLQRPIAKVCRLPIEASAQQNGDKSS